MFTKNIKHNLLLAILIALGLIIMQIPFTKMVGVNLKFTLFDFYGPVMGAFLGSIWGVLVVLVMQLVNWAIHGFDASAGTLIRLFPMLFATLYFAKKSRAILLVPAVAMIGFWATPEGREAWYYALYWLIPMVAYFWHDKFVIARALGATFTAHAVGGVLFAYIIKLPAVAWIGLIPVVWKERGLMAIGIMLTYLAGKKLLELATKKWALELPEIATKKQ
ncbi:MAG: hypothetical protein A3J93_03225 [Candidatus Magasanikbacteria bacterium RIFOXYC2_FULL_42_28]|uniref:ECF transporter S component n=1 Tax=Candidatus Magasanikbacteria bacterium RIFOXYC2_FULL_42_28 TaxID=1798704 RepID=A0A1F6NUC5_9BACT|nr:MAG: hypothetical protein A3J93_03225 [Candidatus Magasanikbacteria bacterium RIFOXYC2_FULL_42_28]